MAFQIIVLIVALGSASGETVLFREIKEANGKLSNMSFITDLATTFLNECALYCLGFQLCDSFYHDTRDGLCRLINGHLRTNHMFRSASSIGYYVSDKPGVVLDFCPEDFDDNYFPGICFKKIDKTGINNEDAKAICGNYTGGDYVGHLLSLTTNDMFDKLRNLISGGSYHVDGFKKLPESEWVDWNGDTLTSVHWKDGEPNNFGEPNPAHEQCMTVDVNGEASDIPCLIFYTNDGVFCQLDLLVIP